MEVIDQDDVFFADLSKQISLLIMDEDNDDDNELPFSHFRPYASFQAFSRVIHPTATQSQVFYEHSCKRDQSKGTGVFIPRSIHPRRKNKQQERIFSTTSSNTKFQKHTDNSRGLPHDLPNFNNFNSFNHKRY